MHEPSRGELDAAAGAVRGLLLGTTDTTGTINGRMYSSKRRGQSKRPCRRRRGPRFRHGRRGATWPRSPLRSSLEMPVAAWAKLLPAPARAGHTGLGLGITYAGSGRPLGRAAVAGGCLSLVAGRAGSSRVLGRRWWC